MRLNDELAGKQAGTSKELAKIPKAKGTRGHGLAKSNIK
jgi:hypothetical protein